MKILVGFDLSDCTNTIVQDALELAKALSAQVWLLHVAEPEPDFVGFDVGPDNERDALAKKFHQEHAQLQVLAEGFRAEGLDATALLVRGATAETILKEAKKLSVGMVVLGSHGGGAVHRLLVGSVSKGVLKGADCPVLIIPVKRS